MSLSTKKIEIAILECNTDSKYWNKVKKGITQGLEQYGYIHKEDINLRLYNIKHNNKKHIPPIISKLKKTKPDLIISLGTTTSVIVHKFITDIPIIFCGIEYPVEIGIIDSMSSSKNNLCGISNKPPADRQIDYLLKIKPNIKTIGLLYKRNEKLVLNSIREMSEVCSKFGIEYILASTEGDDTPKVIERISDCVDAICILSHEIIAHKNYKIMFEKAKQYNLPVISSTWDWKRAQYGCLLILTSNPESLGIQTASMIIKIISGIKPTDIPSETQYTFDLIVNLKIAQELNLKVPEEILSIAYKVIS
jgi:putative ABC transport system substrate-binding protein